MTAEDLKSYRQPMVTAIGLILGFSIAFIADWVTEENFEIVDSIDYLVIVGMTISMVCMTVALIRMLSPLKRESDIGRFYHLTLGIFISRLSALFVSLALCFAVAIL